VRRHVFWIVVAYIGLAGCTSDDSPERASPGLSTTTTGAATSTVPTATATPEQPVRCRLPQPATAEAERATSVYFYCEHAPFEGDPVALPRRAQSRAQLRDALEQLLAGPSPTEEASGFYFFSDTAGLLENVVIRSDGTAVVDFADQIRAVPNITTSGASSQMSRSLAFTIFQFPSVQAVTYRIAGDRDAWCDFFGIVCDEPLLTRARFESLRQTP
jgi:spore germination protein GerM